MSPKRKPPESRTSGGAGGTANRDIIKADPTGFAPKRGWREQTTRRGVSDKCLGKCQDPRASAKSAHPIHVRGKLRIPKSVHPSPLMQWVVLDVNFQETWAKEGVERGRVTVYEYT